MESPNGYVIFPAGLFAVLALLPGGCLDPELAIEAPPSSTLEQEQRSSSCATELGFLDDETIGELGFRDYPGGFLRSVGDMNGDGIGDVAIVPGGGSSRASLRICCSRTGVVLREHDPLPMKRRLVDIACVGDLDSDGCADYVLASQLRGPGQLFRVLLETYSGRDGRRLASREFRGGGSDWSIAGSAQTSLDHEHIVALKRSGRASRKVAPWPTLILNCADLSTLIEVPFPERFHFYRGGIELVDWRRNGTADLVIHEFSHRLGKNGLSIYSVETGELVEAISATQMGFHPAGTAENGWATALVASESTLFMDGLIHGGVLALDLESGEVELSRNLPEISVVGGFLPLRDRDDDGIEDLLAWGGSGWEWEPDPDISLVSVADGASLSRHVWRDRVPLEDFEAPFDEATGLDDLSGMMRRRPPGLEPLPHEVSDHRRRRFYRIPPR